MYLNRKNIDLINAVRAKAISAGFTFAQTTSRANGHYLDACRIYSRPEDKGKPRLAIWSGNLPEHFESYLKGPAAEGGI